MSTHAITLRAFTAQDLPAMCAIWNHIVAEGVAFPQEDALTLPTGQAFFAAQTYTGVAVDAHNTCVGLYILHPNNVGRCGHICNASFAVNPQSRGQGIGELLVRDCLTQGKAHGFSILQFNAVVASNRTALALYRKLGFTQLGIIPQGFRLLDGSFADIIPHYRTL